MPASQDWLSKSLSVIRRLAQSRKEITSDDVWALLDEKTQSKVTSMGFVFVEAARLGYISVTDRVVTSSRKQGNRRSIRVWRSALPVKPSKKRESTHE